MKIAKTCVCCGGANLSRNAAVLAPFLAWRVFGWAPAQIDASWGLRDIPQGLAQAVCNTLTCGDCGLVFLDMRFDDEEMGALYDGYRGERYTAERERFEPGYAARNKLFEAGAPYIPKVEAFLTPHLPPRPRILDWGGDTGLNTPFRGRAALHHVYEISQKPMVEGATRVGPEEALGHDYDLVVLSQVLEHVRDPLATLKEVAQAMKPQTLLYVEVPFEDFQRARAPGQFKRHWHEHINFFSVVSLERLHEALGLTIVARGASEVEAGGRGATILSFLSRMGSAR